MRWLSALPLLLAILAAACGGGGGDATLPAATATQAPPPAATSTPEATPTPSPTATMPAPTPTPRPATVVTTPRPIANPQSTPRVIAPVTPTPTDPGDVTFIVQDGFDDPSATAFYTGTTDTGVMAAITDDGWYQVVVPEETWQTFYAGGTDNLADGVVAVDVGIEGDGSAGVVAREVQHEDGTWSFYLCWIDARGDAGCHAYVNEEWVELFTTGEGVVPLQQVNRLIVSVAGTTVAFYVNDYEIGSVDDDSISAGWWGIYGESYTGTTTLWFDTVVIGEVLQ